MSLIFSLPELVNGYKDWVSKNPRLTSDVETSVKWISYFVAGKINNSHVLSELVYCLSNLLVLLNDRIINSVRQIELPSSGDTLKLWLTVVEYCEVFFEITAQKLWGVTGKWVVLSAVQIFKCVARLILIYTHKETIIQTPPIPVLERTKMLTDGAVGGSRNDATVAELAREQMDAISFTLRSGKVVRRVSATPPLHMRDWKPLKPPQCFDNVQTIEQALAGRQLIAETIYILKPISHLASMACFGTNSWKPWVVALAMDLTSLQLYASCKKASVNALTAKQKLQLSRRTFLTLMYLLRSPFYESHSRDKINALLASFSNNIPLARLVCNPIAHYLPFWQSTYSYMWST